MVNMVGGVNISIEVAAPGLCTVPHCAVPNSIGQSVVEASILI
jgi:hypothetical protein